MARAWLFPGQGSQRAGMGGEVFDRFPGEVALASDVLGWDVREQCLSGADPALVLTRYVQPALFLVSALQAQARLDDGERPDYLAGHSLGEYAALYAAGAFDLGTGVRLVKARGELMGRADGGAMLAVLDAPLGDVEKVLANAGLDDVDIANQNSADQVVLAASPQALDAAAGALAAAGVGRTTRLRVSAAFHSRQMAAAAREFGAVLAGLSFAEPTIPVIANVTAGPYPPGGIRDLLTSQIDGPVRWWQSMGWLQAHGVDEVVEVGPGRVLRQLWQAAQREPYVAEPPAAEPVSCVPVPVPERHGVARWTAESLGSAAFRRDYGVRYAYLAGSMYRGIASVELVARLGQAGLMGFFGAGGLTLDEIDQAVRRLSRELGTGGRFGVNLLAAPEDPASELAVARLLLEHGVRHVEAAAFTQVTPAVVAFRFTGAGRDPGGSPLAVRQVVAKVSRPEVAAAFMSPPGRSLLDRLVADGLLTPDEAAVAAELPVAADVCAESDSGGHTDGANPFALLPALTRLREELMARHRYPVRIRIGAAGGIGSPESAAAAFVLGADFVLTGSINQCSPEAGTSDAVKELLAGLDTQDTAYAPAGDMFELGARVQVVRKSTLFAARANKLHQLYRQFTGLDDLDPATRLTLEERYFRRTLDSIWAETEAKLAVRRPAELDRLRGNAKARMAQVFRWYFAHSTLAAMRGSADTVDYQVHCGPAMGSFNRVVAGSGLQPWRARHVEAIAELIMAGAAAVLDALAGPPAAGG